MSKQNRVVTVTDKKSLTGIGNLGSVGGSSGGNAGQQGGGTSQQGGGASQQGGSTSGSDSGK